MERSLWQTLNMEHIQLKYRNWTKDPSKQCLRVIVLFASSNHMFTINFRNGWIRSESGNAIWVKRNLNVQTDRETAHFVRRIPTTCISSLKLYHILYRFNHLTVYMSCFAANIFGLMFHEFQQNKYLRIMFRMAVVSCIFFTEYIRFGIRLTIQTLFTHKSRRWAKWYF